MINLPEKQSPFLARVAITKWFESVTGDHLSHVKGLKANPSPKKTPVMTKTALEKLTIVKLKALLEKRDVPIGKKSRRKEEWVQLVRADDARIAALEADPFAGINDDEFDLEAGNDPLYLASFLFTTHFHGLLDHVPDLLKAGDLRCFAGQNFENMNNDHRLFWQLTNKQKGKEIPTIMDHHLRVRINNVPTEDHHQPSNLQCPYCTHPTHTKPQWVKAHVISEHGVDKYNHDLLEQVKATNEKCMDMLRGPGRLFSNEVVAEFERLRNLKIAVNAKYYKKAKEQHNIVTDHIRCFINTNSGH